METPFPLDLPRLVMRRAAMVALLTGLLTALLGLQRTGNNIESEVQAALGLAGVMARLGSLDALDDREAVRAVQHTLLSAELRHLSVRIHSADGRVHLEPVPPPADPQPLATLMRWHRAWASSPEQRSVTWQLSRPTSAPWTVTLSASPDSERREALTDLSSMLGLLALGTAAVLLVMQWNVRQALRPLGALLQAIAGIETREPERVRRLPPMPLRELEAIAHALRHLSSSLDATEQARRELSRKIVTLQEDERAHLARELHDEFGQRLTALRLDAAWLTRQLDDRPTQQAVVAGMAACCAEVQQDIRGLLLRLRPLGSGQGDAESSTLRRLVEALEPLIRSWQDSARRDGGAELVFSVAVREPDGAQAPASAALQETLHLPDPLALAVFRLTQEALTNVARHAQARHVVVQLVWCVPAAPTAGDAVPILQWQVEDDGRGLPALDAARQRGSGLGGMQERVWALGGEWQVRAPPAPGHGLRLSARLPVIPLESLAQGGVHAQPVTAPSGRS